MQALGLVNANASVIAVTNTATALTALLDTAAGGANSLSGANAAIFVVENGDIRILWDGNAPTASKGILLKRGGVYSLTGIQLNQVKMIRTGSTDVSVGVTVGLTRSDEAGITGFAPEVGINTAVDAYDAVTGEIQNSTGVTFFHDEDDLQAEYEAAGNTTPQQVIDATADAYIDIYQVSISSETEQWVRLEDNTGTPVVVVPKIYLPANGTVTKVYPKGRRVNPAAPGKKLMVDTESTGNISIELTYRVTPA